MWRYFYPGSFSDNNHHKKGSQIVYQNDELQKRIRTVGSQAPVSSRPYLDSGPALRTGYGPMMLLQRTIGNRAIQKLLAGDIVAASAPTNFLIYRWSKEGVERSLCKTENKGFVEKLNQLEIYEYTKSVCKYKHVDKDGNIHLLEEESTGEFDPATGELFIKNDLSDKEAASTIYHEITHLNQKTKRSRLKKKPEMTPEQMRKQKQEDEYDAWIREETYRIKARLPEKQPGFRVKKGKGYIVNESKVREYVDSLYTRNAPQQTKGYTLVRCWMKPEGGEKIEKPWRCRKTATR